MNYPCLVALRFEEIILCHFECPDMVNSSFIFFLQLSVFSVFYLYILQNLYSIEVMRVCVFFESHCTKFTPKILFKNMTCTITICIYKSYLYILTHFFLFVQPFIMIFNFYYILYIFLSNCRIFSILNSVLRSGLYGSKYPFSYSLFTIFQQSFLYLQVYSQSHHKKHIYDFSYQTFYQVVYHVYAQKY